MMMMIMMMILMMMIIMMMMMMLMMVMMITKKRIATTVKDNNHNNISKNGNDDNDNHSKDNDIIPRVLHRQSVPYKYVDYFVYTPHIPRALSGIVIMEIGKTGWSSICRIRVIVANILVID